MLEFPEVMARAAELEEHVIGKRVKAVHPPTKPHKFCWFHGDPAQYDPLLQGTAIQKAEGFGIFVELIFDQGYRLCFNDGVNLRLTESLKGVKDYQLLIILEDGDMLIFTVAMYGGLILHDGSYDNAYYLKSRQAVSPLDQSFPQYFEKRFAESKPGLSAKAWLATEQRFPGIGNGTLQDILFAAGIHPKRKLGTLGPEDRARLLTCIRSVLKEMAEKGGRDTEKNIFGQKGGYATAMSKLTIKSPSGCPKCGAPIVKETYLGGAVYYCPVCQPMVE